MNYSVRLAIFVLIIANLDFCFYLYNRKRGSPLVTLCVLDLLSRI